MLLLLRGLLLMLLLLRLRWMQLLLLRALLRWTRPAAWCCGCCCDLQLLLLRGLQLLLLRGLVLRGLLLGLRGEPRLRQQLRGRGLRRQRRWP